jgi:hypothetical protein
MKVVIKTSMELPDCPDITKTIYFRSVNFKPSAGCSEPLKVTHAVENGKMTLSWNKIPGASYYNIYTSSSGRSPAPEFMVKLNQGSHILKVAGTSY